MLEAAARREFDVLYFFSLSRLARESVITMPLLKELVYVHKVRIVSVTEGVDSNLDSWELIASLIAIQSERFIKDLSQNVLRGQESAVLAGLCVGDYCFGYRSEPVPGSENTRRSRNAKPRKTYVIDEASAAWVVRIFHWFVVERRSLRWITKELNQRGAPKDHRSTTSAWHHQYVSRLLANRKYVGIWPWGENRNTRNPLTGQVQQEPRPDEECEKWVRQFPHLRIVPDELFEAAQAILVENRARNAESRREDGTLEWSKRGSADAGPRHLLSGLIRCEACGSRFHVGGSHGKYLFCHNYRKGLCTCQTQLRRDRAEQMILDEIGRRILANPEWKAVVLESLYQTLQEQQQTRPTELAHCQSRLSEVERKIERLVDAVENGTADSEVSRRLAERRSERAEIRKTLEQLTRSDATPLALPTEAWIDERLIHLGQLLTGTDPAAAYALRDLVGGRIVVQEIRQEGRSRHHLRGRFSIEIGRVVQLLTAGAVADEAPSASDVLHEEIVIDFVEPDPQVEASEHVKQLAGQHVAFTEIARRLGCSKSNVTRLWRFWFESRGLPVPHGRSWRTVTQRQQLNASTAEGSAEPQIPSDRDDHQERRPGDPTHNADAA